MTEQPHRSSGSTDPRMSPPVPTVPTGESGTTTQAERSRLAAHPKPPDAPEKLLDPRNEPGYAGYQSGVKPVEDLQANAPPQAHPLTWHVIPRSAKLKGEAVLLLAEGSGIALILRHGEWALVQSGTLAYTGIVACRHDALEVAP